MSQIPDYISRKVPPSGELTLAQAFVAFCEHLPASGVYPSTDPLNPSLGTISAFTISAFPGFQGSDLNWITLRFTDGSRARIKTWADDLYVEVENGQ